MIFYILSTNDEFVGKSSTEVTHVEAFSGKRLVQSIWAKYDKDQDGQLNSIELQPLFHDFIGHPISKQDALDSSDEDNDQVFREGAPRLETGIQKLARSQKGTLFLQGLKEVERYMRSR